MREVEVRVPVLPRCGNDDCYYWCRACLNRLYAPRGYEFVYCPGGLKLVRKHECGEYIPWTGSMPCLPNPPMTEEEKRKDEERKKKWAKKPPVVYRVVVGSPPEVSDRDEVHGSPQPPLPRLMGMVA